MDSRPWQTRVFSDTWFCLTDVRSDMRGHGVYTGFRTKVDHKEQTVEGSK